MLENRPDFFIHSGDHIYADCPVPAELKLPDGEIWRNIVTEEKSTVAHSLAQFRGNYKYNLLDENLRAFNAEVPMFAQWDDHEVTNDWSPLGTFDDTGYDDDGTSRLVARAPGHFTNSCRSAPFPGQTGRIYRKIGYGPMLDVFLIDMRSYRDSAWNRLDDNGDAFILGLAQLAWLKRALAASDATWKVIAADLSIGLISEDAIALGDGPPQRREHEIADLLSFMKRAGVRKHGLAHRRHALYGRALLRSEPRGFSGTSSRSGVRFGPAARGHMAPGELDNTFGPSTMFQKGCSAEQGENLAPCFGLQFFGHVDHRRCVGSDDGDLEGRRQQVAMVGRQRTSAGRACGTAAGGAHLGLAKNVSAHDPESGLRIVLPPCAARGGL